MKKNARLVFNIMFLGLFVFRSDRAQANLTLSLNDFLKIVEQQSPDLAIEKSMVDEAISKSNGVRIPPPMVGFMNMKDAGGNNQGLEISQELPLPTKIIKEKKIKELELSAQKILFQFKKIETLSLARNAYFEYWMSFEKNKILNEKKQWFQSHLQMSRALSRSDNTTLIHFLEIESSADLIDNEISSSEALVLEKKLALRTFAPELNIDDISPTEPEIETLTNIKALTEKFENAMTVSKKYELKSLEATVDLKKQSYWPDLFLRYRNYQGNDMTPKNEEFMVGFTLPFLYFWQPQSEANESLSKKIKAEAELSKIKVESANTIQLNIKKMETLHKQIMTLKNKIIPRAYQRIKLLNNQPARNLESLDSHRMVMLDLFELRNKEIEYRYDYEKTFNDTRKLTMPAEQP